MGHDETGAHWRQVNRNLWQWVDARGELLAAVIRDHLGGYHTIAPPPMGQRENAYAEWMREAGRRGVNNLADAQARAEQDARAAL